MSDKPFRAKGEWWLPETPERKIAGELDVPAHESPQLELSHLLSDGHPDNRYEAILGTTLQGEPITLESAFQIGRSSLTSRRLQEPIQREILRADWGYRGAHLATPDERRFRDATIDLPDVVMWAGAEGFADDWDRDMRGIRISLRLPEPLVAELPGRGRLTLGHGWTTTGDHRRSSGIERSVGFRVETPEPIDVRTLLARFGNPLRYLLTFVTDRPNEIEQMTVKTMRYDSVLGTDVGIDYAQVGEPRTEPANSVGEDYLFDAVSLGDRYQAIIAGWFDLYDQTEQAMHQLFAPRYRSSFADDRFLNATGAAESYHRATGRNEVLPRREHRARVRAICAAAPPEHRDWLGRRLANSNEPSLYERLVELHARAFNIVAGVIGSADEFARPVVQVRNRLTHRSGAHERIPGRDLLRMTEQTVFLITACLLLDLGFDEMAVVEATRRGRRFRLLTEVLRHA